MNDFTQRIAALSPEKRRLLELRLKRKGVLLAVDQQIPRRTEVGPSPLSFAQERLWFLDQFEPDSAVYNVPVALRLNGSLNATALESSLNRILARHEVLRTSFRTVEGKPLQIAEAIRTIDLHMIDLEELSGPEQEAAVVGTLRRKAREPFDLARGPLLRAALLRLQPTEHIFFLCLHHIVSDEWSSAILFQELAFYYNMATGNGSGQLDDLPIQYADYALWQRQWLQGEVLEGELSYWKEKLAGAPPSPLPPLDHTRPPRQTYQGARVSRLLLPGPRLNTLKALSREQKATQFMTLLAAFKVLLYRYTRQQEIVVGTPVANRNRAEVENLIGFFLNTLVLRTDFSGQPTFRELLGQVREVALDAYDHQEFPFEKLVAELLPERALSHSPLFQVLFVQQTSAIGESRQFSGLTLTPFKVDTGSAKFDLTLFVREETDGLRGTLEYNTNLFEAATMERFLLHLHTLLQGIVDDPDVPISRLPLLTPAEHHQLLVEWNSTEIELPNHECVHHLFETQAAKTPDAVAIRSGGQQLTYSQVNSQANQLAHYLQDRKVGPETLVAVCLDRSPEMVVSVLAILKAGGAYLPLDLSLPQDRQAFMLEDAQAPVLLTQKSLLPSLPELRVDPICLDMVWEHIAQESAENPVSHTVRDNLAYMLYTSGSTGVPKGVAMHQQPLYNLIQWQIQNSVLCNPVRMLQLSPLSFDASFVDIFWTFCSGGTLVLAAEELGRDATALLDLVIDESVNRINLPVIALQQLAEAADGETLIPGSLAEIVTTAEQLHITPAISNLIGSLPGCTLHNQYGPTESHVVTVYTLQGPPAAWPTLPPIGRPIANTQIYLLDANLQPVPVGITGDLYIGGDSLSRGYLNRPGLTAERFIPNPFSSEPGARLYCTGDLARYQPDGNIEFLGRSDHQVKIRGYRVELGEIEAMLGQHSSIQQAFVLVRQNPETGIPLLVAYIFPVQGAAPTTNELRGFLKKTLPEYMMPSVFVILDDPPLTASGKVDRRALPRPELSRDVLENEYVDARTPVEQVLADIWRQILGIERVGVHDNFFELGGHSLLATQIISRVRTLFQQNMALRAIFEAPTVAEMSQAIVAQEEKPGQAERVALLLRSVQDMPSNETKDILLEMRRLTSKREKD